MFWEGGNLGMTEDVRRATREMVMRGKESHFVFMRANPTSWISAPSGAATWWRNSVLREFRVGVADSCESHRLFHASLAIEWVIERVMMVIHFRKLGTQCWTCYYHQGSPLYGNYREDAIFRVHSFVIMCLGRTANISITFWMQCNWNVEEPHGKGKRGLPRFWLVAKMISGFVSKKYIVAVDNTSERNFPLSSRRIEDLSLGRFRPASCQRSAEGNVDLTFSFYTSRESWLKYGSCAPVSGILDELRRVMTRRYNLENREKSVLSWEYLQSVDESIFLQSVRQLLAKFWCISLRNVLMSL